jgi:hypothetical protein
MSVAPEGFLPAPVRPASGPRGAPYSADSTGGQGGAGPVQVRFAEVIRLQPGDRLLIHVDGGLGMGPGGSQDLAEQVIRALKIDELSFNMPVAVTGPGFRLEVIRP